MAFNYYATIKTLCDIKLRTSIGVIFKNLFVISLVEWFKFTYSKMQTQQNSHTSSDN